MKVKFKSCILVMAGILLLVAGITGFSGAEQSDSDVGQAVALQDSPVLLGDLPDSGPAESRTIVLEAGETPDIPEQADSTDLNPGDQDPVPEEGAIEPLILPEPEETGSEGIPPGEGESDSLPAAESNDSGSEGPLPDEGLTVPDQAEPLPVETPIITSIPGDPPAAGPVEEELPVDPVNAETLA